MLTCTESVRLSLCVSGYPSPHFASLGKNETFQLLQTWDIPPLFVQISHFKRKRKENHVSLLGLVTHLSTTPSHSLNSVKTSPAAGRMEGELLSVHPNKSQNVQYGECGSSPAIVCHLGALRDHSEGLPSATL